MKIVYNFTFMSIEIPPPYPAEKEHDLPPGDLIPDDPMKFVNAFYRAASELGYGVRLGFEEDDEELESLPDDLLDEELPYIGVLFDSEEEQTKLKILEDNYLDTHNIGILLRYTSSGAFNNIPTRPEGQRTASYTRIRKITGVREFLPRPEFVREVDDATIRRCRLTSYLRAQEKEEEISAFDHSHFEEERRQGVTPLESQEMVDLLKLAITDIYQRFPEMAPRTQSLGSQGEPSHTATSKNPRVN
jgi:hypothetical protein